MTGGVRWVLDHYLANFRIRCDPLENCSGQDCCVRENGSDPRPQSGTKFGDVGVLERIAAVLDARVIEFFREPLKNEPPPRPLPGRTP